MIGTGRASCAVLMAGVLVLDVPMRVAAQVANPNQTVLPPGATALPDPVVRAGNQGLSTWLGQLDANFSGPRVDGEGRPLAAPLVDALKLTHMINIKMLSQGAATLDGIRALTPAQKLKLLDDLGPSIKVADDAYINLLAAEVSARDLGGRGKSIYDTKMAQANAIAAKDPQGAATLRADADRSAWGVYLYRRDQFFSVLNQQPLLGLVYDTYLPLDERYLFKKLYMVPVGGDSTVYNTERLRILDVALENTAGLMRGMAADALEITEFEGLLQYTEPRYAPVWAQAQAMAIGPLGLPRYADLVAPLEAMGEAWRYDSLITTTTVDVLLNIASTFVVIIPVWGPLLGAGLQFVQVVREGNQYRVALVNLAQAEASAPVFGQARVISAQDRVAAERGEFVLAGVSGAFDVGQAVFTPVRAADAKVPPSSAGVPPSSAPPVPPAPPPPPTRGAAPDPSATLAPPVSRASGAGVDPSATLAPPGRGGVSGTTPDPNATIAPPVSRPPGTGVDPSATLAPPSQGAVAGATPDPNATLAPPGRSAAPGQTGTDGAAVTVLEPPPATGVDRGAVTVVESPPGIGVDRAGVTVIDVPEATRDAAALGSRIDDVRQQLADVNEALDPLLAGARPDLVKRRSEIAAELAAVDTELNELRPLQQRAIDQPLGKGGAVDRGAGTLIDVRQLGKDIQALNARRAALQIEQSEVAGQLSALADKLGPELAARQTALESDLKGLIVERSDVTDLIAREIGSGDYEAGIVVYSDMMRQRQALGAQMDQVRAEIANATDPALIRSLERRANELQARFNDLSLEYFQVGKYLGRQQDRFELEEALEFVDEQRALARENGVPESRIEQITQGLDTLTDADDVAEVAEQLVAARMAAQPGVQVINAGDSASATLLDDLLQDFTFVRSAILEARANGGKLSDTAIAFINVRRAEDPNWFQNLPTRVVEDNRAGQFFRAADENLVAELQGLFDQRGTSAGLTAPTLPSGVVAPSVTQAGTPPAGVMPADQVAEALRLSQTLFQLTQTTGQVVKAVGELPRPPTATSPPATPSGTGGATGVSTGSSGAGAASAPAPVAAGRPVTLTPLRASQLADLGAQIASSQANVARASQTLSDATLTEEQRSAARRDYYVALDDQLRNQVTADQIRLNQLWEDANNFENGLTSSERAEARDQYYTLLDEQSARSRQWSLVRVMRDTELAAEKRTARMNAPAPSPPATAPVDPAPAVPPPPRLTETEAREASAPNASPSMPAPVVRPAIPLTRLTAAANPALIIRVSADGRVQLIGGTADDEITVPGAAPTPSKPQELVERLAQWLQRPPGARLGVLGLHWPSGMVDRTRPVPRTRRSDDVAQAPGIGEPLMVLLTSTGRSAGDAFQMTVINRGAAPVRLDLGAVVLEPVANAAREALARTLAGAGAAGRTSATLKGYCLEFLKPPPAAGMVFRIAPDAVHKRFAHLERIFAASRALGARGALRPPPGDPSNATEYFDAIRQWAIWTREQSFDERAYTRAFVEHSRKNVVSGGRRWSADLERAIAALAPARWTAIQEVLRTAETVGVR